MTYVGGSDLSQYSGNGDTTEFPTGFRFLENTDVKVLHTSTSGADTPLAEGVDYTLTGAGEDQGTVVFPKLGSSFGVLAVGERLTVYLDPGMTQERSFSNASVLPLGEIEEGLDRLTMISRSMAAKLKRAVMYPMSASEEEVGTPQNYIAEIKVQQLVCTNAAASSAASALEAQQAQEGAETARAAAVVAKDAAVEASVDAVQKSSFTAAWDFLVGSAPSEYIKKTAAEVQAYLGGLVGAYTKQQYAVPGAVTPTAGAIELDADLHQDAALPATGNCTFSAPIHAAAGKTMLVTLYAAYAYTIGWNAVFKSTEAELPTAFTAGKNMYLNFRYNGTSWVLLGMATEV